MSALYQFDNYKLSKKQYVDTCKRLYDRMRLLYEELDEDLEEIDRVIFKKLENLFNEIDSISFLSLEEQQLFLDKSFIVEDDYALNELSNIMSYLYMTYLFKKQFLKQKGAIIEAILFVISEYELPYTSFEKIFKIFLNDEFVDRLNGRDDTIEIRDIMEDILDEINFERNDNFILTNCFDFLDGFQSKEDVHIPDPERDIDSIYQYYLTQMNLYNHLFEEVGVEADFKQEHFDTLKKIVRLKFLSVEEKEEFYDWVEMIRKNNGVKSQIELLLLTIRSFLEKLPQVVEGGKHENRRL